MEMRFPLILDGATGTQLQKRGYQGDVSAEQWVLDHPDSIQDIQRRYVQAGSQIVYAPTFGANRQKLEERGIFNQTAEYNRRLTALSQQAVEGRAWVAGDISPTGLFLSPLGEASFEELVDIYAEQAAGLEQAGVDLFVVETMMTLADAGPPCWPSAASATGPSSSPSPATRAGAACRAPTWPPRWWCSRAWGSAPSA